MTKTRYRKEREKYRFFVLNDKMHKIIRMNRAKDEVVAWCYDDNKRYMYAWSVVRRHGKKAYNTREVSEMLNRSKITISQAANVALPHLYKTQYPNGRHIFGPKQVFQLHDHFVSIGRHGNGFPTKKELSDMMSKNLFLYAKMSDDEEERFIPVWDAQ